MKAYPALQLLPLSALLVATALSCAEDAPAPEPAPAPSPGRPVALPRPAPAGPGPHLGIDVSHHSGTVDWESVEREGYAFAVVKATEGVDAPDPMFETHWETLAEVGLLRGAYHFYVTEDDPREQAEFFLSRVELIPGDLAPVVDIELIGHGTRVEELPAELRRFLDILERETGVRPILYTPPNFWDAHFHESFRRYPLWVAEYGVQSPQLPEGWSDWVLWQFEGDAEVPGVEKGADRSKTHPEVDFDALRIPFRLR